VRVVMVPPARLLSSLVRSEACKGRRGLSGAWTRVDQVWVVLSGGSLGGSSLCLILVCQSQC
jgi:hypothetical protein